MNNRPKWLKFWGSKFADNVLSAINESTDSDNIRIIVEVLLRANGDPSVNTVFHDLEELRKSVRSIIDSLNDLEV